MFSKAKRFDPILPVKSLVKDVQKNDNGKQTPHAKLSSAVSNPTTKANFDTQSHSSTQSVKSFVTPKQIKSFKSFTSSSSKVIASIKKPLPCTKNTKVQDEIIKAQEVEIKNKDHTIIEHNKLIEELKCQISTLENQIKEVKQNKKDFDILNKKISEITLNDVGVQFEPKNSEEYDINTINELKNRILELEKHCEKLENETSTKQIELCSLEETITIRDSLCKDLQDKLTNMENCLEETCQRLEMVKGHHALALEANESIRREYKAELDSLKIKLEEEKQVIITKSKTDQENIKAKYNALMESLKNELIKEKCLEISELHQQLYAKDQEMKAKLEQINESSCEKLRLCEIQFEERSKIIQEHCDQQQTKIQYLETECKNLKCNIDLGEEQKIMLQKELQKMKDENEGLNKEKLDLLKEINDLKEDSKKKLIDFDNEINKLTANVDKITKEKCKFEMSLSVTRDIVQVLTMRLRNSDNELELLEGKVQVLTNSKEALENELATCKSTLKSTEMEFNEYKEALVNILKSKAALAKEHTRIMEHNVSLIESLQNVEKEAYRELGTIKNELIDDVEMLKKESDSQIQMLREEVEKKRMLCQLATEHAGQATVAAEQSRILITQAASEINRLEAENTRFQQQIQDQQSLVVELSLLRQENEELTMTVATQSSIIDKLKKDIEVQQQIKPQSPSVIRKAHKIGKENLQVVSPLRERNH